MRKKRRRILLLPIRAGIPAGMSFNSILFIGFFIVVLGLYRRLRDYRHQNAMLLVASYVFYSAWDWRFLSLIIGSTLLDFFAAQRIHRARSEAARRFYLYLSLAFNLGMLGVFKYLDFGIESLSFLLQDLGFEPHLHTLQIILPVGISFYTFQTISYTVDVYRGEAEPITDLVTFALYVAYFPQLVAGPIERSTRLLPQFQKQRTVTTEDYRVGFLWILLGYFKKIIIADSLAPMIEHAFGSPNEVSGMVSLVAIWAFAIQIYGDFAGYTLIARGLGRLMGIRIIQNFDKPYLARNPREFWYRWHISLSSWMRRYLYFGLGGNRKGTRRTYVNLLVTMLLAGLWHGASWNFVLWGGYCGVLVMICYAFDIPNRKVGGNPLVTFIQIAVTFGFTLGGWLIFRASDMENLRAIVINIFTRFHWTDDLVLYARPTLTMFVLLMAYHVWQERTGDDLILLRQNRWVLYGVYVFILATLFVLRVRPQPFVYFQF